MTQDNTPQTTARPRRQANRQANSQPPQRPAVSPVPPAIQAKNVTTAVPPDKVGIAETKKLLTEKIDAIRRVIPKGVQLTAEGLIQNALLQMETARDRSIKLCTPRSILYSVMAADALDALCEEFTPKFIKAFKKIGIIIPKHENMLHYTGTDDERPGRTDTDSEEWILGFGLLMRPWD